MPIAKKDLFCGKRNGVPDWGTLFICSLTLDDEIRVQHREPPRLSLHEKMPSGTLLAKMGIPMIPKLSLANVCVWCFPFPESLSSLLFVCRDSGW